MPRNFDPPSWECDVSLTFDNDVDDVDDIGRSAKTGLRRECLLDVVTDTGAATVAAASAEVAEVATVARCFVGCRPLTVSGLSGLGSCLGGGELSLDDWWFCFSAGSLP